MAGKSLLQQRTFKARAPMVVGSVVQPECRRASRRNCTERVTYAADRRVLIFIDADIGIHLHPRGTAGSSPLT
jgi:hypothetical protein